MSDVNNQSNFGDSNFAEYIARERDRLRAEREQIFSQQEELQRKLDAVNRESAAIEAYETAKTGKAARQGPARRQRQARRGSRREGLLELIRQSNGLSRGDILEKMGLKGDKAGEMSVSNALTALAKGNQVRREGGKVLCSHAGSGRGRVAAWRSGGRSDLRSWGRNGSGLMIGPPVSTAAIVTRGVPSAMQYAFVANRLLT